MNEKGKIGIMTFHEANNYGAVLQAFALQVATSKLYNSEILNFHNKKMWRMYRPIPFYFNPINTFKHWARIIIFPRCCLDRLKRRKRFSDFSKKYLKKSKKYFPNTIKEANRSYDAFITGSDQVWNPAAALSWEYFLEFADNSKKFSYAASFGANEINKEFKERIKNDLSSFSSILVREKDGANIVDSLNINKIAQTVCDPTFLLTKSQWIKELNLKEKKSGYIFVYTVAPQTHTIDAAKRLAEKQDIGIIMCSSASGKRAYVKGTKSAMGIGPIEFMELILNAKYVFTTSFHGLALSIIMNTPFFYELNQMEKNCNSRIENLVDIFDIKEREITSNVVINKEIDWCKINYIKEKYVSESKIILFESLNGI